MTLARLLILLALLLVPQAAQAADTMTLVWDFPRTVTAEGFRITVTDLAAQKMDQLTVAPSAEGACGPGNGANTFCAQLPTCPPPGLYALFVQAKVGAQFSSDAEAEHEGILCHMLPTAPCHCAATPPVSAPAPPPP